MPSKGKEYGNASQVTVHIDDYGGMKGYADGGSVRKQNKVMGTAKKFAEGGKVAKKKKKKKPKKPKPGMLGTGTAAGAGKALSGRAEKLRRAEEAAGI